MSVTMREMLEAGVHFGHQTRFWNPRMAPFIYGHRNKIHIINLERTLPKFDEAMKFVRQLSGRRGTILMVGTKRQAREVIATEARRATMPYVDQRWLGGMLTNFKTVKASLKKLKEMQATREAGLESMTKKESLMFERELAKLEKDIGGIQDMNALPDALFVIDVGYHKIAVSEAKKLGIPVVGVVDTNHSPEGIDYVIPGNDDSAKAVALYARAVADAVLEGKSAAVSEVAAAAGGTAVPGRHTRGVAKMAAINASMVAELRAKTDAPMMECKRALTEADGDMARAEEILRVKLGSKAGKAASRITAEGVVAIAIDGPRGAIVEVNCETDFVSKNEAFVDFAQACADLVVKHDPADLAALAALPLAQGGFGPTVEDVRKGLIGKIGENMSLRRFERVEGPARLASYLHGRRIGVIVRYQGSEVAARDVAMHVAAMKPVALAAADVPAALIERERRIAAEKAAEDAAAAVAAGKPAPSAEIVARRVEGAVQKFLKESSLLDQAFVKNDKQSVAQMLAAAGTQVSGYTLYVVGEGIAKRSEDFAAEVAAQVAAARQP